MKKGFFSHQVCFEEKLLDKYIVYLTMDDCFQSVQPFRCEVSLTTFSEGVLFVVSPDFSAAENDFRRQLTDYMEAHPAVSVGEAILATPAYRSCRVTEGGKCRLYTVMTDWSTGRLRDGKLTLSNVL